ncbi:MAG TPA: ATP-binding protein [Sedimentisphaerales bacterium]|nr:ATP-binding protein [Sedimentisphaerales bacterium]
MKTEQDVIDSLGHCVCGGHGFFRVDVSLGHPLFGKAIPCICKVNDRAQEKAASLRRLSGISEQAMTRWTFESFHPEWCKIRDETKRTGAVAAMRQIKDECQQWEVKGWRILIGPYGSGKTHLAYAIAGSCLQSNLPVYAALAPDMLGMLRSSFDTNTFDECFDHLRNVELLVIDDLATEHATAWATEKLFQIVDHRYVNDLPLVITTNVDIRNGGKRIEGRIVSRLLEGTETEGGRSRLWILPVSDFRMGKRR